MEAAEKEERKGEREGEGREGKSEILREWVTGNELLGKSFLIQRQSKIFFTS